MYIELLLLLLATANTVIGNFTYWKVSSWQNFYRPIVLFIATYIISLLLICLFYVVVGRIIKPEKHKNNISKLSQFLLIDGIKYINYHALVKLDLIGKEKVPYKERFLFVCNHVSNFDPMLTYAVFGNKQLAFITKPSNMKIPFAGKLMKILHFLPIHKEDKLQSLQTINEAINLISNDVCSIAVYPEGTRHKDGILGEFHEGVFNIALKAKCPIVVSTIYNTNNIHNNFPFKHTHVVHEILTCIPYEEIENMTCKAISDNIKVMINERLSRYKNEQNLCQATTN